MSKASSNFSSEEYRQRFRIKRRGVSPPPPYAGFLVSFKRCSSEMLYDIVHNGNFRRDFSITFTRLSRKVLLCNKHLEIPRTADLNNPLA